MRAIQVFPPMQNKIIRWGILGCGDVTEIKSGPALQKAIGSELVAVMRRAGAKAADYARRHQVPFWTNDSQVLINRPEVDIVYIATPPGAHLELALEVCAAGKPCYVEKPMARSARESRVMVEAFAKAGLPLFVAFYRRGQERFITTKALVEQGRIGTLTSVHYTFQSRYQPCPDPLPWRLNAADAGAGLFYDLGSHVLDILDFIFGPLQDVRGLAANRSARHEVEDTVAMSFSAGGVPAVARWNFSAFESRDLIEVEGTRGRISLSCFGNDPVRLETHLGTDEFPCLAPEHVHQGLVQTIVDELRGIGACPSTGISALRTMEVMDCVLASYYGGREDEFWKRPGTWPGQLSVGQGSGAEARCRESFGT